MFQVDELGTRSAAERAAKRRARRAALPPAEALHPLPAPKEVVQEAVQNVVDLLKEFDEINEKFAEPMDDDAMNKLIERQGEVQEKLDQLDAWTLDSKLERAMDALRCPPDDALVSVLSGGEKRRVALCRLLLQ